MFKMVAMNGIGYGRVRTAATYVVIYKRSTVHRRATLGNNFVSIMIRKPTSMTQQVLFVFFKFHITK